MSLLIPIYTKVGLTDTTSFPECRFVEEKDVKCSRVWGVEKVRSRTDSWKQNTAEQVGWDVG